MKLKAGQWTERARALFPEGTTFHFIEAAHSSGPRPALSANILIEAPNGEFRRPTGEELALIEELWPGSLKRWRIEEYY